MTSRLDFHKASPDTFKAMLALEAQARKASLDKRLMELVRIRASQVNGCAYCVDMHTGDARKDGETERRLAAVAVWHESPFFTPRERAALAWTEAVTRIADTRVPDDAYDEARAHYTEQELIELTLLVNTINCWNRFAVAFRAQPE